MKQDLTTEPDNIEEIPQLEEPESLDVTYSPVGMVPAKDTSAAELQVIDNEAVATSQLIFAKYNFEPEKMNLHKIRDFVVRKNEPSQDEVLCIDRTFMCLFDSKYILVLLM